MRRTALFALMITLLALAGCNSAAKYEEEFADYRASLGESAGISLTANVRADYGEKILEYTLRYEENAFGNTVEVLSPELVSGVKAHFEENRGTLEFDGLILDGANLTKDGLTPLSALFEIVKSLKSGYLQKLWIEDSDNGAELVSELAVSDSSIQTLWMDAASMTPLRSEIKSENKTVIYCEIFDWTVN